MERTDALGLVEQGMSAATGTPAAFGFWYAFSYIPPALLVGREARAT